MFDSRLNPDQRRNALLALASQSFDILIIGGGVTGAGAALDAASRGLRVALVEANDLASGTSSRSSKLIHGGLRYLEQYDFRLVREALQEREAMVTTLAPHLVKPVAFLYPLQEKKDRTYVGAGLTLYDVLRGFQRTLPWHKHLSQKSVGQVAPSLRQDVVTGAVKYFDAQVDDARHTMMIARTAARHGAIIATSASCQSLRWNGGRVVGAVVEDSESGEIINVKASVVVMCAGVWSDALHERFSLKAGYDVRMSKGVHIVLPGSAISSEAGVILKTPVSVLFVIPWQGKWILGTTDTEFTGDPSAPLASREDVAYIIEQANRILHPPISASDVIGVYAGLRPLVSQKDDTSTTKLSREHTVDSPAPGFVSVAGGKYTTYRIMAEDVIDAAVSDLIFDVNESFTDKIPLVGADGYNVLLKQIPLLSEETNLSVETLAHLLDRYGSLVSEVINLVKSDSTLGELLDEDLPYIKAEIHYAASHEGAKSVEDVIYRRTRISFESADSGMYVSEEVSRIIAPILGWSNRDRKRSLEKFHALLEAEQMSLRRINS